MSSATTTATPPTAVATLPESAAANPGKRRFVLIAITALFVLAGAAY